SAIPQLTEPGGDPIDQAEQMERARLARMAGQARESQVFFRLQLKAPPQENAVRAEPSSQSRATSTSDANALTTLRTAEQTRALVAGGAESSGTDATESLRKLTFLRSGAEKEIYNPHGLQTPASPYQL